MDIFSINRNSFLYTRKIRENSKTESEILAAYQVHDVHGCAKDPKTTILTKSGTNLSAFK